jgi:hypothetical protein
MTVEPPIAEIVASASTLYVAHGTSGAAVVECVPLGP